MKKTMILLTALIFIITAAACGKSSSVDYTIHVVDQNNDPVENVMVNICTDTTCSPQNTDDKGIITFSGDKLSYHIEIIKVPEGYRFEEEDIYTEDKTEITITITKD